MLSHNVGDKPNYTAKKKQKQKIGILFHYLFLNLVFIPALLNYKYKQNEGKENIAVRHSHN